MKNIKINKLFLTSLMLLFCITFTSALNPIECGTFVTEDVILEQNLSCSSHDFALNVSASNVNIDCNGFSITGLGGTGILVGIFNNINIRNCDINNFDYGIRVFNSNNISIENNGIYNNGDGIGIYIRENTGGVLVKNNIINNSAYGFYLYKIEDDVLINNNIVNNSNRYGIYLEHLYGDILEITGNTIENTRWVGIILYEIKNDILINSNIINNNGEGIYLQYLYENDLEILENKIENNNNGIYLKNLNEISIINNNFHGNIYGINSSNSNAKLINNNFINNQKGINADSNSFVNWILTKDVNCDNEILIMNGNIFPFGGKIIGCNVLLNGKLLTEKIGQAEIDATTENNYKKVGEKELGFEVEINTNIDYIGNLNVDFYNKNPINDEVKFRYMNVSPTKEIELNNWTLKIYYTDEELANSGFEESSLRIEYINETSKEKYIFTGEEGGVNVTENYVWVNMNHFGMFGITENPIISNCENYITQNMIKNENLTFDKYLNCSDISNPDIIGKGKFNSTTENNKSNIGKKDLGFEIALNTISEYIGDLIIEFYDKNPINKDKSNDKNKFKYVNVTPANDINLSSWILKIYYTDKELKESGFDENSLRIEYINETDGTKYIFTGKEGGINITGKYIWAISKHFSVYGITGSVPLVSLPTNSGSSGGGSGSSTKIKSILDNESVINNVIDANEEINKNITSDINDYDEVKDKKEDNVKDKDIKNKFIYKFINNKFVLNSINIISPIPLIVIRILI